MAIEIRPTGEAAATAAAGRTIGKAKAKEAQRAEAQRAQEMAFRQQQVQAAREWEMQKMLMNSQQDFAHEMRMRQADLDKEARAEEWQTEKMELASRLDFEQEEKERLRRTAEYTAGRDNINDNQNLTSGRQDQANFLLSMKYADVPEASAGLGLKPGGRPGLFDFGKETPPAVSGAATVDNPLGRNIENIPVSQLPQAVLGLEAQNKFEVISPDGNKETIDADQWPDKKAQGYILSQISKLRGGASFEGELKEAAEGLRSINPVTYFKSKTKLSELEKTPGYRKYLEQF